MWRLLGLEEVIAHACAVDRAGDAILAYLLNFPAQEAIVLGVKFFYELMSITCWYLWWERRKLVHKEHVEDAKRISQSVRAMAENFVIACDPKAVLKKDGWRKPPNGFVKLNVDVAFDYDALHGVMGAVIRDDRGHFIVSGNKLIESCYDTLSAEALALKFGLQLSSLAGCNRFVVNSDSLELMEIMTKDGQYAGNAAAIIDDCYHLACEFSSIRFEFCPREANAVAHELASVARSKFCSEWIEMAPNELLPLLLKDVSVITNE